MIKVENVQNAMQSISIEMTNNRDYLVQLDAQNGDGDLGISMDAGFKAVSNFVKATDETDLGRVFLGASKVLNENAPSSLGTILSFLMMGMAKSLKGKEEVSVDELTEALQAGLKLMMEKAGSEPGQKTIIDSISPAVESLQTTTDEDPHTRFALAAKAAADGSENTKQMLAVHGRAAYYGDKSIGVLDGGSVVGKLIFEGIFNSVDDSE